MVRILVGISLCLSIGLAQANSYLNDLLNEQFEEINRQFERIEKYSHESTMLSIDCESEPLCMFDEIEARANDTDNPNQDFWQGLKEHLPERKVIEQISTQCDIEPIREVRIKATQCLSLSSHVIKRDIMQATLLSGNCVHTTMLELAEEDNLFALRMIAQYDKSQDWESRLEQRKDDPDYQTVAKCTNILQGPVFLGGHQPFTP